MGETDKNFTFNLPEPAKSSDGRKKRMKNLPQYKDLSDEEFNTAMERRENSTGISKKLEERISQKLSEFEKDYDLSDLKINDRETLRALIQAILALEDYEQKLFVLRSSELSDAGIYAVDKLHKLMSDLRSDISKMQNDLNITRKIRKSDQDVSVMAFISNLKEKAKKFYDSKMGYIFCPKCNMLLGTIWTLYPMEERNKVALVCNRTLDDGTKCGEKVIIGTKELVSNRGTNKKEITPDSFL